MIERNGVELVFHHLGIPTTQRQPNERYSPALGMYTSENSCPLLRVQWHRFDDASSLPLLLRTVPHAAFKVADLERAIAGGEFLLGP